MRPRRPPVEPIRPVRQDITNDAIRSPRVRLIGDDGAQLGVKTTPEALDFAYGKNLDLVLVAPQADPPVAKVMDYSKYRYEQEQKAKLARKHQSQIHVKEIKLRPKIGIHDYNTKKGHVERFLNQRAKVKVTIMFRGRETTHPERGRDLLMRLAEDVKELGVVESPPLLDGRNMVMLLGPSKTAGVVREAEGGEGAEAREPVKPKPPSDGAAKEKKDAETEETQRSEEALQADGDGEAPAPARDEEPSAGAQVAEA